VDATPIDVDRRCLLRTLAFAQHKAVLGILQIPRAEFLDGDGPGIKAALL
jgi:hypothetical protein